MENDQLRILDVCSRLPYGVYVKDNRCEVVEYTMDYHPYLATCIPYLRHIDTMSDDEITELCEYIMAPNRKIIKSCPKYFNTSAGLIAKHFMTNNEQGDDFQQFGLFPARIQSLRQYDWLVKNGFDVRGLIPMGQAKELTDACKKIVQVNVNLLQDLKTKKNEQK